MTAQRQESRRRRRHIALVGFVIMTLVGPVAIRLVPAVRASTTERVVANRFSGLAIEGFDPVAYFVEEQPVLGLADYEAAESGAVWRFRNEGNLASFRQHPDVYGPQFGGYDPVDVARGVTFAGNPRFFAVTGQRLYLFGMESHRDAFAANPERYLPKARECWPRLVETLSQ